ncbi:hypothetical protein GCM10018952_05380 [Streptosporangium vulgare]
MPVVGKLPITPEERAYIKGALSEVASDGHRGRAFSGFPMDKVKTSRVKDGDSRRAAYASRHTHGSPRSHSTGSPSRVRDRRHGAPGRMGGQTRTPRAGYAKILRGIYGFKPTGSRHHPSVPAGWCAR